MLDSPILLFREAIVSIDNFQYIESSYILPDELGYDDSPFRDPVRFYLGRPIAGLGFTHRPVSIGYRASWIDGSGRMVRGVVTAAHHLPDDSRGRMMVIDHNGWRFAGRTGPSDIRVDATFVGINDSSEFRNHIDMGVWMPGGRRFVQGTSYGQIIQGGQVHTLGRHSGVNTGRVVNLAHTETTEMRGREIRLTLVGVSFDLALIPGDSGSIVFSRITTNPQIQTYGPIGIIHGRSRYVHTRGYFVRASTINALLGIRLY